MGHGSMLMALPPHLPPLVLHPSNIPPPPPTAALGPICYQNMSFTGQIREFYTVKGLLFVQSEGFDW